MGPSAATAIEFSLFKQASLPWKTGVKPRTSKPGYPCSDVTKVAHLFVNGSSLGKSAAPAPFVHNVILLQPKSQSVSVWEADVFDLSEMTQQDATGLM